MVKHYVQNVNREEINNQEKMQAKLKALESLRKRDFITDHKKASIKNNIPYKKQSLNAYEFLQHTSDIVMPNTKQDQQIQGQLHSYRVAKANAQTVLDDIEKLKIKNERPPDYLVEMYKSDKQMFKVRRFITEKEERVKEKLQGKDWMSKAKRKQRAKKKAAAKKEKKKAKVQAKKPTKPRMDKINGKKKIKK